MRAGAVIAGAYLVYSVITDLAIWGGAVYYWLQRGLLMKKLQANLNRLAENLSAPVAVILEGRDTAGKSSTIRELTHYLPPDLYSVCLSHKPTKQAMASWLPYWETKLPRQNRIVFLIGHGIPARWFSISMDGALRDNTKILCGVIKD